MLNKHISSVSYLLFVCLDKEQLIIDKNKSVSELEAIYIGTIFIPIYSYFHFLFSKKSMEDHHDHLGIF